MFTERFFGKPKLWKPLFLRMNYKLQKSSFSHSISSNIDYQIRPFHIENVGMSNSTCRHPVTGWNNGSHNINSQPDSAIKWKKRYQKQSWRPLASTWHGVYSSPSVHFCTSAPTQRTERGSCAELKALIGS